MFFSTQHKISLQSYRHNRRSNILDIVHTKNKSLTDASYFVTCVDFILKSVGQIFSVINHFHANVERKKGRNLKCVIEDIDGKYRGILKSIVKIMKSYLKDCYKNTSNIMEL